MAKKKKKIELEFFSGDDDIFAIEYMPTGLLGLDVALGGGLEQGTMNEIYGEPNTFKSVLLRHMCAHILKEHLGESFYCTSEHDYRRDSAASMYGIDPKLLKVAPVGTVEEWFAWVQQKADERIAEKDSKPCLVALDSIANIGTTHSTSEDTVKVADKAKAITDLLATGVLKDIWMSKMIIVAINQVRDDLKAEQGKFAEKKVHTPGGRAWRYNMTHRIYLKWAGSDASSDIRLDGVIEPIGKWVVGKVQKNRHAPHNAKFYYPFYMKAGYKHPTFRNVETKLGIDFEEAAWRFYRESISAVDPETKERWVTSAGPRWTWHPKIAAKIKEATGEEAKSFYGQDFLDQIKVMPGLMSAAWLGSL